MVAAGGLLQLPLPPRSSWLLLWLLLTGFTGAVRFGPPQPAEQTPANAHARGD